MRISGHKTPKKQHRHIMKPADKGRAIIIMDKPNYIKEGHRKLSDTQFYALADSDLTGEVIHRGNLHVHDMIHTGQSQTKFVFI